VLVHISEHVHGQGQLVERHLVPVAGEFPGGIGVEHAAGALDQLGDLDGVGAALRALEEQMLHVMRDAVGARGLSAGADADEEVDADRLGGGDFSGDDTEVVG
jgi:hypothetical protein